MLLISSKFRRWLIGGGFWELVWLWLCFEASETVGKLNPGLNPIKGNASPLAKDTSERGSPSPARELSPVRARGSEEAIPVTNNRFVQVKWRDFRKRKKGFDPTDGAESSTAKWVVHLEGGKAAAERVIRDLGYRFHGEIKGFEDVYLASDKAVDRRQTRSAVTGDLASHPQVTWAQKQIVRKRDKRSNALDLLPVASKRKMEQFPNVIQYFDNLKSKKKKEQFLDWFKELGATETMFNDDLWTHQWYLFDTRMRKDLPKLDLNVVPVWKSGVTGKGVTVLIIDDGLEWKHQEIIESYNAAVSYDFNDDDPDPTPRRDESRSNGHGTRCAGEIVMKPNNHKCGVGIAFGASIGGVRTLDGNITDLTEGLSIAMSHVGVDVVSCSWGPTDDGKTVDGPQMLAQMALEKGVTHGRDGKGVIYVWASGNGGVNQDNCNFDGYVSSIFTIGVNSASERGQSPFYNEHCSSTLTSTYSSGAYRDQKIVSSDLDDSCTIDFTGTSAASPLAAGIIALALEVNPRMTWRDVQHVVVRASQREPLARDPDWSVNGAGFAFNPKFGFGLLNGQAMVDISRNWTAVPDQKICTVAADIWIPIVIKSQRRYVMEVLVRCEEPEDVRSLEHVELVLSLSHSQRGALEIYLTSPAGTRTQLLSARSEDKEAGTLDAWPLVCVHLWGEDPGGSWTIAFVDTSESGQEGSIEDLALVFYGT